MKDDSPKITRFEITLNTLSSLLPPRDETSTSKSSPESVLKIVKLVNEHKLKIVKKHSQRRRLQEHNRRSLHRKVP